MPLSAADLAETRVTDHDVIRWLDAHPVFLSTPPDILSLILEERGIPRESVRMVYPDPLYELTGDRIVRYEKKPCC